VPYSPEYAALASGGVDLALLDALARLTGGGELSQPVAAFLHNLPSADRAREIWQPLLLLAALLFPIDVAVRRVMLGRRDVDKALAWVRERLPSRRRPQAGGQRILGPLFQARDRVRGRTRRAEPVVPPAAGDRQAEQAHPSSPVTPSPQPQDGGPDAGEDALARLRRAKRRARDRERKE
jgi:hypothetical protein